MKRTLVGLFWLQTLVVLAAPVADSFGKLPLSFEQNRGQADSAVRFLARTPQCSAFVTEDGVTLVLGKKDVTSVRMQIMGARPSDVTGENQLPGTVNYLRGKESDWRTDISTFACVRS